MLGFLWKLVMEDLEEATAIESGRVVGREAPRVVVGGFTFPTLPLISPTNIDYFK